LRSIRNLTLFLFAVSTVISATAQEKGFKIDPATGVEYRFIKHEKKATSVSPPGGDFGRVIMLWTGKNAKGDADSVYLNSRKAGGDSLGALTIPLKKSFRGSLEDGISMMMVGDSAVFRINADSLFIKTFHAPAERIPHFIKGTVFTFNIKLLAFKTNDEMLAERNAQIKKRMQQAQAIKGQESIDITAYLQKNNLASVKPDADSIFYLQTTKGTGPLVQEGDSVEIKYKGTYLDGGTFDPGSQPINMVYSRSMSLIQGWVKIIGKMNGGDKVRVLIPSKMGYGANGMGPIKPYTPLIFDMELVSVKPHK
jgi:FKBP-type peptidyl-prolyl cis-trans isomerase FkpA